MRGVGVRQAGDTPEVMLRSTRARDTVTREPPQKPDERVAVRSSREALQPALVTGSATFFNAKI